MVVALTLADCASAEDFRIDNATYAGGLQAPLSQSTTIFHQGAVYDFMRQPDETVVFEREPARFVLLSSAHRIRTELPGGKVAAMVDGLQPLAAKSKIPLVKFLAQPKFQEQYDQASGELTLRSPLMNYRLMLQEEVSPEIVEQYHEFRDWCARLNALTAPGAGPPFGQLVVNAAIAKRQAIASRIYLTVAASDDSPERRQNALRSEHRLTNPLEPSDLDRVEQTRKAMNEFKLVSFEQYRKTTFR